MTTVSKNEKTLIRFNEYVNRLLPHVKMYGWKGVDKLRRDLGIGGITKKQFIESGLSEYLSMDDVTLGRDVTDAIRAKIYQTSTRLEADSPTELVVNKEIKGDLEGLSLTLDVTSAPNSGWKNLPEYPKLKNTSGFPWVRMFDIDGQLCVFATETKTATEYLLGANIKFDGPRPILGAIKRVGKIPSKAVEYALEYPQYRFVIWTILRDAQTRLESLDNEIITSRETIRELQSTVDEGKAVIDEKVNKIIKLLAENAELKAFLDTITAERDEYREKYREMKNATFLQKIARLFR